MAAEDGDRQYSTLDRSALAGIDQYKLIKTVRVEDDGRIKLTTIDMDNLIQNNSHTGNYELRVFSEGHICAENTTSTPLAENGEFEGAWQDTLNYSEIIVGIKTDKASITDGLVIAWSADGINIDDNDVYTIGANDGKVFSFLPTRKYVKIYYTNGAEAQSFFRLQTQLKRFATKGSSHRIKDAISNDDDASLHKAVITGEDDNGVFRNVKTDFIQNIRVNSFPYTYSIAEGVIKDHLALLKFGTRTSVAANTNSLIWEGTNALYTYLTTAEFLQVSSNSVNDTAAGTGARTLTILGLDNNFNEQSETITLNGLTQVTTTKSFLRVFRSFVVTTGTSYVNEGLITITNNAGTNQLLVITAGDSQTLMTMWTVPAGYVAYVTTLTFSTDSNKGARVSLRTRLNDGGLLYAWQIKYRAYAFSGNEVFPFQIPFKIPEKTDIEVRVLTPASAGSTSAGSTFELWYEVV